MNILNYFKEIWRGKNTYRILMNEECGRRTISGKALDIGSGLKLASYHRFLKKEKDVVVECLDLGFESDSGGRKINLEKDTLPVNDDSIDTIIIFNLLEHIYDNALLIEEMKRVLKNSGDLIGSVPVLVGYHADPHDYWRYTSESLKKIFLQRGFSNAELKIIGKGPFTAAFFQIEFILPRILRMFFMPIVFFFDKLFFLMKPRIDKEKFALGLFFVVNK